MELFICIKIDLPLNNLQGLIYHKKTKPNQPINKQNVIQGQHFKQSLTVSKTGCHIKVKELSLTYNLSLAGGRIFGHIPFWRVLTPSEM